MTDTDDTVFIEHESIVMRASDNSMISMSSPNEEGTLSSTPVENDMNSGRDNAKSVQQSPRKNNLYSSNESIEDSGAASRLATKRKIAKQNSIQLSIMYIYSKIEH